MTRRRLVPRRIAFRHSAPRDVSAHQELLGRAPEFEASYDGFEAELGWPRLAVTEVAYLVGFNDPSAFFKAFRRWTGVTPSEYRTSLLDPAVLDTALLDPALPVQTG